MSGVALSAYRAGCESTWGGSKDDESPTDLARVWPAARITSDFEGSKGKMKASVVIPVWNGMRHLRHCLDAILQQDFDDYEIIVVDNASQDGSADFIESNFPQARLIRNPVNLGFAGGCNTGLRCANGEIIVLLNQDTQVQQGWLAALHAALQRADIGLVGCKILYADGRTLQHAGGWIQWPVGLAHHFGYREQDDGSWDLPRPVEYVTGAALALRRSMLETVGYLDEGFGRAYFEDADYCLRVKRAGFVIWYEPTAVLVHLESSSTGDREELSLLYQHGRLRLVLKHLPPARFLTEFIPGERARIVPAMKGVEWRSLRASYLRAIPEAAAIYRSRGENCQNQLGEVVEGLLALYWSTWEASWNLLGTDGVPTTTAVFADLHRMTLQEFKFGSSVPVIGGLLTWLRQLWYAVAAKHAVRHLTQQQNAVNQALFEAVTELTIENQALARGFATAIAGLTQGEEGL